MQEFHSRFARVPEPELMLGEDQARAYARADFEDAHAAYPRFFRERFPDFPRRAAVLDLGCGPCDVTRRFARLSRQWRFDAVDGSSAMLEQARRNLARRRLLDRVRLIHARLPRTALPRRRYDIILATSLLHHLPEPMALWQTVRARARRATLVFVADLRRPRTRTEARRLTRLHAAGQPAVLRRDFHNSLLAAFTPGEVRAQLSAAGLTGLAVEPLGDRHLIVHGHPA